MRISGKALTGLYLISVLFISLNLKAQHTDTLLLKQLLEAHAPMFDSILNDPARKEVQIIYTQINRDKKNRPHFSSFSYRLNSNRYFYPASTVKLPTAIFALEKIHETGIPALTKETTMFTDSSFAGQTIVKADPSARSGLPSIDHYIRKVLLVSDNDAYNRLYEFTGRERINSRLRQLGINNTRITGRLAVGDKGLSKKNTNPVRFVNGDQTVYQQPAAFDPNEYPMTPENMIQGWAYLNNRDSLVREPFSFAEMNVFPLYDQQMILRKLIFPKSLPRKQRFRLTGEDYRFLYRYMSMFPNESSDPVYSRPEYFPTYCKFLFYGSDSSAVLEPGIRIFNKIGDSYGYNIDNAYIVDLNNNIEFMLSAVVQSNNDGIYNDNRYEYNSICLPFLRNLGRVIYDYEKQRTKKYTPDLSEFRIHYTDK